MIIYKSQITDLRINAPHIKCSVVMPGQIGTSIRANTRKIHSGGPGRGKLALAVHRRHVGTGCVPMAARLDENLEPGVFRLS